MSGSHISKSVAHGSAAASLDSHSLWVSAWFCVLLSQIGADLLELRLVSWELMPHI